MISTPTRSKAPPTGIGVKYGLNGFPTWREAHTSQALHQLMMSLRMFGHQLALPNWLWIFASLRCHENLPWCTSLNTAILSSFGSTIRSDLPADKWYKTSSMVTYLVFPKISSLAFLSSGGRIPDCKYFITIA